MVKRIKKRIVKEPDIRRGEIILAARKLFEKKGYTATPIEAIIQKAGIAKGTFYYYFKSKKDILSALVEDIGREMEQLFHSIIENNHIISIDKLKLIFQGQEKRAITKYSLMEVIHKPENRELQEQLNIQAVAIIAPLITQVFEQGYHEGIFNKKVTIESIQVLIAGSQFVLNSGLFDWSAKKRMEFLKSIQTILEQLADVKPGVLNFICEEV
jgi:AcrR family transcriptional regulator